VDKLSHWAEEGGVGALIRWRQTSQGKWEAEKVHGDDGKPRRPSPEMIACFFLEMAKGDGRIQKGGSQKQRQHPRYRPHFGKVASGSWMVEPYQTRAFSGAPLRS
jgi:hypothetical protein